jgi:hypothetical protein
METKTSNETLTANNDKGAVSCWRFAAFFIKGIFTDGNEFYRMTYGWTSDLEEYNTLAEKFEKDRLKRLHSEEELDKELTAIKNNSSDIVELKVGMILVNDKEGVGVRYACS